MAKTALFALQYIHVQSHHDFQLATAYDGGQNNHSKHDVLIL